ncbi:uncharacterized protein LOC100835368 [Brachypodium distachyon]|uniref:Uncharacterized protein n=1 Tax=Brachypodium distachyon TaxID=15368 RepID=C3SAA4_BRADI|nr:uncharacterized protein LOC100835368 [Brachypodium distachyon]ACF22738.1 hypothetical protein-1 [Brachypodium distachyon]KQK17757.1 hypothetical protein BRADI_1g36560v3 [Brachypodium distachyon]|eukprot:XP_003560607.2 uncharacterized protein LOC100835368 [Brachypodium distachyon]
MPQHVRYNRAAAAACAPLLQTSPATELPPSTVAVLGSLLCSAAACNECRSLPAVWAMASSSSSSAAAAGSALGGSHAGLALAATAMALSGTLVLFNLCRAKPPHLADIGSAAPASPAPVARLRPCLSSSSEKRRKREKARRSGSMTKRVRFADDVVDNGPAAAARAAPEPSCRGAVSAMPANREALYRGMLRGRSMLRTACSSY